MSLLKFGIERKIGGKFGEKNDISLEDVKFQLVISSGQLELTLRGQISVMAKFRDHSGSHRTR